MISVAIIDDSKKDIEKLENMLRSIFDKKRKEIEVESFNSYKDIDLSKKYNLYFIDIDMPDKNGYEVSKLVLNKFPKSKIVFCTNYNDLVFESFQIEFFGFVRKDHLDIDAVRTINKYLLKEDVEVHKLQNGNLVRYDEIIYIETGHNYLTIFLMNGGSIKERTSMKKMGLYLPNCFFKISSGYIVNLKYVKTLFKDKIILINGIELYPSRSSRKKLACAFNEYILEK